MSAHGQTTSCQLASARFGGQQSTYRKYKIKIYSQTSKIFLSAYQSMINTIILTASRWMQRHNLHFCPAQHPSFTKPNFAQVLNTSLNFYIPFSSSLSSFSLGVQGGIWEGGSLKNHSFGLLSTQRHDNGHAFSWWEYCLLLLKTTSLAKKGWQMKAGVKIIWKVFQFLRRQSKHNKGWKVQEWQNTGICLIFFSRQFQSKYT